MHQAIYDQSQNARRYEIIRLFTPSMFEKAWFSATDMQSFDQAVDEAAAELLGMAISEMATP